MDILHDVSPFFIGVTLTSVPFFQCAIVLKIIVHIAAPGPHFQSEMWEPVVFALVVLACLAVRRVDAPRLIAALVPGVALCSADLPCTMSHGMLLSLCF
jgi:hypothetical protein